MWHISRIGTSISVISRVGTNFNLLNVGHNFDTILYNTYFGKIGYDQSVFSTEPVCD